MSILGENAVFSEKCLHQEIYGELRFSQSLANVPILYPLKTPENLDFSGVFRGYKMGTLARNGLIFMFLETDNVPLLSH